jgi:hypothetical protein
MAVALAFIDVGLAQRRDAIAQHRPRGRIHDAERQALGDVLGGGDAVAPVIEEKVRPLLEAVGIDCVGIAAVEIGDAGDMLEIHWRVVPMPDAGSAGVPPPHPTLPRLRGRVGWGMRARRPRSERGDLRTPCGAGSPSRSRAPRPRSPGFPPMRCRCLPSRPARQRRPPRQRPAERSPQRPRPPWR